MAFSFFVELGDGVQLFTTVAFVLEVTSPAAVSVMKGEAVSAGVPNL